MKHDENKLVRTVTMLKNSNHHIISTVRGRLIALSIVMEPNDKLQQLLETFEKL